MVCYSGKRIETSGIFRREIRVQFVNKYVQCVYVRIAEGPLNMVCWSIYNHFCTVEKTFSNENNNLCEKKCKTARKYILLLFWIVKLRAPQKTME